MQRSVSSWLPTSMAMTVLAPMLRAMSAAGTDRGTTGGGQRRRGARGAWRWLQGRGTPGGDEGRWRWREGGRAPGGTGGDAGGRCQVGGDGSEVEEDGDGPKGMEKVLENTKG